MDFYSSPVPLLPNASYGWDRAWLFKEQDKCAKTAFPIPGHQGTLENSTWHEDSTVLWNNLQCDPIVPQWGRQATAHSRVIDWINSLIPNRWIEYWCLVRPDHKRKTQSAPTAQRFNPPCSFKLQSLVFESYNFFRTIYLWILSIVIFITIFKLSSFLGKFFSQNVYKQGRMFTSIFTVHISPKSLPGLPKEMLNNLLCLGPN